MTTFVLYESDDSGTAIHVVKAACTSGEIRKMLAGSNFRLVCWGKYILFESEYRTMDLDLLREHLA